MGACPRCNVNFPPGISLCPNDGTPLLADNVAAPTESLVADPADVLPLASQPESPATDLTRAERPSARRGTGSSNRRSTGRTPRRRRSRETDNPHERVGQVLGQYRLLDVLGRGGMGCVYEAEHIKLGRRVALKLLRAEHAQRRDAVARFFQEARAVNRIRHRNIVDVTDFVELDDGTTFIIMELLGGVGLGRLAHSGALDRARTLAILIQICDGLAAAHRVGIIHRDLKPDNIIVVPTPDGADLVKLLDFGVAKLLNRDEDADDSFGYETAAGAVIGTPAFMSPEQAGGMDIDPRSDIYSLGAIMYEITCGQPVFRGKSFGEFVRKHLNESPVAPSDTPGGRNIDPKLEAMILRCLAKNPNDRYQSADELREELVFRLAAVDTSIRDGEGGSVFETLDIEPDPTELSGERSASKVTQATGSGARRLDRGLHHESTAALTTPRQAAAPPSRPPTADELGLDTGNHIGRETAMTMGDLPATRTAIGSRRPWLLIGMGVTAAAAIAVAVVIATKTDGSEDAKEAANAPTSEQPRVVPKPAVTPIDVDDTPRPRATAKRGVTVRFESSPPGAGVYPLGEATRRCLTPCEHTIDRDDGGSPNQRNFILRRNGFRDHRVAVDLRKPPETVSAELEALPTRKRTKATKRTDPTPPVAVQPNRPAKTEPAKPKVTKPKVTKPKQPVRTTPKKISPSDTLNPFEKKE